MIAQVDLHRREDRPTRACNPIRDHVKGAFHRCEGQLVTLCGATFPATKCRFPCRGDRPWPFPVRSRGDRRRAGTERRLSLWSRGRTCRRPSARSILAMRSARPLGTSAWGHEPRSLRVPRASHHHQRLRCRSSRPRRDCRAIRAEPRWSRARSAVGSLVDHARRDEVGAAPTTARRRGSVFARVSGDGTAMGSVETGLVDMGETPMNNMDPESSANGRQH